MNREYFLNTYTVRNLSDGKGLGNSATLFGYHGTFEKLYPFGKSKLEETAAKFGVDCAARMPVDAKMSEAFDKGEAETAEQAELVPVLDKIESL